MRVTRKQLEETCESFNRVFSDDATVGFEYEYYVVEDKKGKRKICSGTPSECQTYLFAMMKGKDFYVEQFE